MKRVDTNNEELILLSKRIKEARLFANLSQEDLGKALGVSDKAISRYEQASSIPTIFQVKKIAKVTNFPASYFMNQDEKQADLIERMQLIEKNLASIQDQCKEITKTLQKSSKNNS